MTYPIIAMLLAIIGVLMAFSWVRSGPLLPKRKRVLIHHHEWTDWTDWIEETVYKNEKYWTRQRVCHGCGRRERREVGRHECNGIAGQPCPHREAMAALFEDKVTRLERDLGIKGDQP